MERRVSPRTQTSIPIAVSQGKTRYLARCVELSQTGLLAIMPRSIRESPFEYVSARLMLDNGIAQVLLRRIRHKHELIAYLIVDVDDASQALLTDFLFDQLHSALPRTSPKRASPKPVAA